MKKIIGIAIVLGLVVLVLMWKPDVSKVPPSNALTNPALEYLLATCTENPSHTSNVPVFPSSFSIDESSLASCNTAYRVDLDRDGHLDLIFPVSFFASNQEYGVWIYNTDSGVYESFGSMVGNDVPNVINDGTIASLYFGGGNTWREAIYKIDKEQKTLIQISDTEVEQTTPTPSSTQNIMLYDSGIKGQVLLGPTCPVMRDPPDPGCADRPYKTTVLVYQAAVPENLVFAKTDTDADGQFTISLRPGVYRVEAQGGNVMPRCSPWVGSLGPNEIKNITISCDTGIR